MVETNCGSAEVVMAVIALVGTLLGLVWGHLLTMWLFKKVRPEW